MKPNIVLFQNAASDQKADEKELVEREAGNFLRRLTLSEWRRDFQVLKIYSLVYRFLHIAVSAWLAVYSYWPGKAFLLAKDGATGSISAESDSVGGLPATETDDFNYLVLELSEMQKEASA